MKYIPNLIARACSSWRVPQRWLFGLAIATVSLSFGNPTASAQSTETGSVSGRVLNGENGVYLGKAQVTAANSTEEAYTDDFGQYTISKLPAGPNTLKVFFTGQTPINMTVNVIAGQTVQQDFTFNKPAKVGDNGELVLNEYVIETNRYKNAQEIAINEERASVTLKNVVAADTFGKVANGNVGEFVKFLPGVQVDYGGTYSNGALASQVSVRGFGPEQTNIMIDGRTVADPSPASMTRAIGLDMLSINNVSRVEVIKVSTPDMPSTSPGGAINLITKSSFEYAKPEIVVSAQTTFNTEDTKVFEKEAGPANKKTFHTLPGGDISVIEPITHNLGITFSASSYNEYSPTFTSNPTLVYAPISLNLSTAGGKNGQLTNALGQVTDLAHPALTRASVTTNPWADYRNSGTLRVDWKPLPGLLVNASYGYSTYKGINVTRRMQFQANDPMDFGPDFTIGTPYVLAANTTNNSAINTGNNVQQSNTAIDKSGNNANYQVTVTYDLGPWHFDAGVSRAQARGDLDSIKNGHFSEMDFSYTAGQVSLLGIHDGLPASATVKTTTGGAFDYTQLANYSSSAITGLIGNASQRDIVSIYNADLRRDLNFLPFDMSVKIGVYRKDNDKAKWGLGTGYRYDYVGPTLSLDQYLDSVNSSGPGFGYPAQQWGDTYKFYGLYQSHPEYFSTTSAATQINNYNSVVGQSKDVTERTDNYYAMIDGHFFHNRLSYVGGARSGHVRDDGFGPYRDPNWKYVENPDGSVYKDSIYPTGANLTNAAVIADTALRARLAAVGLSLPTTVYASNANTTDPVVAAIYNRPNRPIHSSQTQPITPTAAASFNITDNLVAKVSWSKETILPNIEDSGTNGGLLSGNGAFTIADNFPPTTDPGGDGTIKVANPALRPQTTESWNFTLAYYTKTGGSIEGSYYLKNIKNQWETANVYNSDPLYSTVLNDLGLSSDEYKNYVITTTQNGLASASNNGYELSVTQNLGILADLGKHFDVFATYSHKTYKQSVSPGVISLSATSNDLETGGIRFNWSRLSMSLRGTHRNAIPTKGSTVSYGGVSYQLYNVAPAVLKLDAEIDFQLTKRFSLFASASNITNRETQKKTFDATNVVPQYAYVVSRSQFGTEIVSGITARF